MTGVIARKHALVLFLLSGLGLAASRVQASPFPYYEDWSAYPPGTTNTVPDTFRAYYGNTSISNYGQFFSYEQYEDPGDPIAWRIVRNDVFPNASNKRLLYMGTDTSSSDPVENPFLWEDYTVRTVFSGGVTGVARMQLMARVNDAAANYTKCYMVIWNFSTTIANGKLTLAKDFSAGTPPYGTELAVSENGLIFATNTLYTMELIVQGANLTANLYLGTDVTAENALKLTVTTEDSSYSAGSFAIANRPGNANDNHYVDFWSVEAIPEPGILALFGLGGLALFGIRRRSG